MFHLTHFRSFGDDLPGQSLDISKIKPSGQETDHCWSNHYYCWNM